MEKKLSIRSSAVEFLIFETQGKEDSVEVSYEDNTLWLTQKMMARLFSVESNTITYHLKDLFKTKEITENSTTRKFRVVQKEGGREVSRDILYYNLEAIISVGYRVNSIRATQFRRWATQILQQYAIKGYVLDKKRMENGTFLGEDYFEELLEEIREIRLSERRFYQKITDIYSTSMDYNKDAPITKEFFAKVQNKLHFAVSHQTAAEIVYDRADHTKQNRGLTTWKNAPNGKIIKSDVAVAKNYLSKEEIDDLEHIVSAFLDIAENRAKRKIPMTMEDWAGRIDKFLLADDRDILKNAGKISAEIAKDKAESEFEIYRVIQDKIFKSDFDLFAEETEKLEKN